jgi:hypothetical protein
MMALVLVDNSEGYSEAFGTLHGLTVTETDYGYVGIFKGCSEQKLLEGPLYTELFSIELDGYDTIISIEHVKLNFVDQFGYAHFCAFRPLRLK